MTRHVFDRTRPGDGTLRLRRYLRLDDVRTGGKLRRFARIAAGRAMGKGQKLSAFAAIDRGREV